MAAEKRKPAQTPQNKAIDPAPENKAAGRPPAYWQYERSGTLKPVIVRYLSGARLDLLELDIMREYCRQWIGSPVWDRNLHGAQDLINLRAEAAAITSNETLAAWLQHAEDLGCDPL